MADLQELLARLNGQATSSAGAPASNQSTAYHQPSVSSPIFSPSPNGPQPHHASAVMSPNSSLANTPGPENGQQPQTPQQQSAQLLNLLRFNSQSGASQQSAQPRRASYNTQASDSAGSHGRQSSASNLVASFMGKATSPTPQQAPAALPGAARLEAASASPENPQDILLRLLNHKPSQPDSVRASLAALAVNPSSIQAPEMAVDDVAQDLAGTESEKVPSDSQALASPSPPMRVFGSDGAAQGGSSFKPDTVVPKPTFTYVNPFDKFEAASPRNRTPVSGSAKPPQEIEILKPKHGLDASSSNGGDGPDSHTHKVRKLSPSLSPYPHETVAEAVSDLADQVGQQVGEALAEAENKADAQIAQDIQQLSLEEVVEVEEAMVATATDINEELKDKKNVEGLKEMVGEPIAEALKDVVSQVSQPDVADSWESAETEDGPSKDEDTTVTVYRFPMRAFSSITVQNMPDRRASIRPESFMDIARLRKEFDQIDRSLVAASKNFIVYALVKKGGFKIIRQENGDHRQVFENHHERIFNIALCANGDDLNGRRESILGIGVNGSVFWTSLEAGHEDQFSDNLDSKGIVLPPSPSQDDNTSGGQLKTRAKPSSRHPEFFAVGRGKSIHIVWPQVAADYVRGGKGICHTEKYLKERSLKILTGKAGKDFTFSEDDTVIVSLDKAGRMRFWDIRRLTDPELGLPHNPAQQVEVSDTLLEFHTISPSAKSWPTSVFFFDKDKPFSKGIALRYVMVGMKQNHSFQLWDLGLGKAVQEINLPHEKESDAICSVSFHPRTGIMAVAHPTRNSIFFVHVSCPRYNLPVMNQATYIGRLAAKDKSHTPLPPVNATAIMTSIAEYSFASKGQIRSLHMLNEPAGPPDYEDIENAALFELYVMHSKGVCTIRVRRSDLGWKRDGEPLNPKDGEQEGVIVISTLKLPQPVTEESSTGGDTPAPKSVSDRSVREIVKKESSHVSRQSMTPEAAMRASTLAKVESKQDAARAAIINGGEKSEKKKKKRATTDTVSQVSSAQRQPPPSYAQAAHATPLSKSPAPPEASPAAPIVPQASEAEAPEWFKKHMAQIPLQAAAPAAPAPILDTKQIEAIVQNEIGKAFPRELEVLYKRLDEDKRIMNASSNAKQDAVLRLVSATLTENVESVMNKMVTENIQSVLLPKMLAQTSAALEKSVGNNLKAVLGTQLSKEVPDSVLRALKNPQVLQGLSETVATRAAGKLEPAIVAATGSVVSPAITNLTSIIEQQIGNQLRRAETQRKEDANQILQLTNKVQALTEIVQSMTAAQTELKGQLNTLQEQLSSRQDTAAQALPQASPHVIRSPAKAEKTPEERETETITRLMTEGNFEQGTMMWLQSNRTTELFNSVFVRCNPGYLSEVSPLLNLSTGAVVTDSLDQHLTERLIWLDAVLKNVDPQDPETHDIVPKIMEVMNQRLTAAYIKLNESSPGNPLLRHISALVTRVNDLARAVA